jgi:hypothetical protein
MTLEQMLRLIAGGVARGRVALGSLVDARFHGLTAFVRETLLQSACAKWCR